MGRYVPLHLRPRVDPIKAELTKMKAETEVLRLRVDRAREAQQQMVAHVSWLRDFAAKVVRMRARDRELDAEFVDAEVVLHAQARDLPELAAGAASAHTFREYLATLPSEPESQGQLGQAVRSRARCTRELRQEVIECECKLQAVLAKALRLRAEGPPELVVASEREFQEVLTEGERLVAEWASAASDEPTYLVVDALNFLSSYFLPVKEMSRDVDTWTLLRVMEARVEGFLLACERSKYAPNFVIDDGYRSEEAQVKWTKRREDEVRDCTRGVMYRSTTMLEDVLISKGAMVWMVNGEDGDDAVATLANNLGDDAVILSNDRDMFRYDFLEPDQMRCEFAFHYPVADDSKNYAATVIHLFPSRSGSVKEGTDTRTESQMPEYEPEEWHQYDGKPRARVDNPEVGVPVAHGADSQETREHGNLHGISKPLRLAMYYEAGLRRPVVEQYPEWDEVTGNVVWMTEEVLPEQADGHFRALLKDKVAALRWLQKADPCKEDGAYGFRGFARHAIVAECVGAIDPEQSRRTMLSLVRELHRENLASGGESVESHGGLRIIDPFGPPTNRTLVSFKCTTETCGETLQLSEQFIRLSKENGFCSTCRLAWIQRQTAMQMEMEALSKICAGDICGVPLGHTLEWIRKCARTGNKLANYCESCKLAWERQQKAAVVVPGLWEWWKHPQLPGVYVCTKFVEKGRCDYFPNCKHHHPAPGAPLATQSPWQMETNAITQSRGKSSSHSNDRGSGGSKQYVDGGENHPTSYSYSHQQAATCTFFLQGHCKAGNKCKFHHPACAPSTLEYPKRPGRTVCDEYVNTRHCLLGAKCPLHHPADGMRG
mmetsp:Transcript_34794/g.87258  ORF Transcript_34794/g.87258 Transcript_34794/m.87258 type:complete len:831 (-) Transcript_34794:492-2984(-)